MKIAAEVVLVDPAAEGLVVSGRDLIDARNGAETGEGLVENGDGPCGVGIRISHRTAEVSAGKQQVVRVEAERLMQQDEDRGDHPSSACDQNEREGELRGDQKPPGTPQAP